jgi:integrase
MGVYGTGTLIKRGRIWYYSFFDNGHNRMVSSKSAKKADAIKLRDRIVKQKMSGTLPDAKASKVTCGELLDDALAHIKANGKASTAKVWGWVIERKVDGLREFFGGIRATAVTTEKLNEYRTSRVDQGRSHATANRELSILRTAFHLGRKTTPPKVLAVPYFKMTSEAGNVRQGFLTHEQYAKLRDALPEYLKPLFVVAAWTGIRKGELLSIRVNQVDLERGFINLRPGETKSGTARIVPVLAGDMDRYVRLAVEGVDGEDMLFRNESGNPLKDFRGAWKTATKSVGMEWLRPHDLRRTASRFMRNAGVPQTIRMRIMGHRTDSMDRRYGIIDDSDIEIAKRLMEAARKPQETVPAR